MHEEDEEFDDTNDSADEYAADDDDSVDTRPCPYCGKPVYEQAELCPHCRSYISTEDSTPGKPRWIVIVTLLTIAALVLAWVFRRI